MTEAAKPPNILLALDEVAHADLNDEAAFVAAAENFRAVFRAKTNARGLDNWDELVQLLAFEEKLRADPELDDVYAGACMAVRELVTVSRQRQAELN